MHGLWLFTAHIVWLINHTCTIRQRSSSSNVKKGKPTRLLLHFKFNVYIFYFHFHSIILSTWISMQLVTEPPPRFVSSSLTKSWLETVFYVVLKSCKHNIDILYYHLLTSYGEQKNAYLHIQQIQNNITIHVSCFWSLEECKSNIQYIILALFLVSTNPWGKYLTWAAKCSTFSTS